jgi:homoserine kinase
MSVSVKVPATTANLGAGFDCIGAALSLYNQFTFSLADDLKIVVHGAEAEQVDLGTQNLAYQAFAKVFDRLKKPVPGVKLEIDLKVPFARGLGSSATAIVGGLLGGNELAGSLLSPAEIREMAITMEGHPDNVVPALIGGCRLAASYGEKWEICDIPWHSDIVPVVAC